MSDYPKTYNIKDMEAELEAWRKMADKLKDKLAIAVEALQNIKQGSSDWDQAEDILMGTAEEALAKIRETSEGE